MDRSNFECLYEKGAMASTYLRGLSVRQAVDLGDMVRILRKDWRLRCTVTIGGIQSAVRYRSIDKGEWQRMWREVQERVEIQQCTTWRGQLFYHSRCNEKARKSLGDIGPCWTRSFKPFRQQPEHLTPNLSPLLLHSLKQRTNCHHRDAKHRSFQLRLPFTMFRTALRQSTRAVAAASTSSRISAVCWTPRYTSSSPRGDLRLFRQSQ